MGATKVPAVSWVTARPRAWAEGWMVQAWPHMQLPETHTSAIRSHQAPVISSLGRKSRALADEKYIWKYIFLTKKTQIAFTAYM